jgi:serine protease inhibitor ecotin
VTAQSSEPRGLCLDVRCSNNQCNTSLVGEGTLKIELFLELVLTFEGWLFNRKVSDKVEDMESSKPSRGNKSVSLRPAWVVRCPQKKNKQSFLSCPLGDQAYASIAFQYLPLGS